MNADFSIFQDLKQARETHMILEGRTLLDRLYESGREAHTVLCVPESEQAVRSIVGESCKVHTLSEGEMSGLVGFKFHRGVLAAAALPVLNTIDDFYARAIGSPKSFHRILVCPRLADPANLGNIFRNAAGFGWDAVMLGPGCCSPYSRKALRVSMGACLKIPCYEIAGPGDLVDLGRSGFLTLGTTLDAKAVALEVLVRQLRDLETIQPGTQKIALVLGHEYEGLRADWSNACSKLATIPMPEGHDSLNVALASGIFMYRLGYMGCV